MANYRAVSSGVWSDLARWQDDGSGSYVASTVLPGAADTVRTNNFTVTLDINTTILFYTNGSATGVTAGGTININSSRTWTITNGVTHGTGTPITISGVGHTITINASWNLGNGLIASFATSSSGHTVNFNGNFFAPTTSVCLSTGTSANNNVITFTGNVVGNAGNLVQLGQTNNTCNVIGNLTGAGTGIIAFLSGASPIFTVTGIIDTGTGTNNVVRVIATGTGFGTFRLNSGVIINRNGVMAIAAERVFIPTSATTWTFQDTNNVDKILYDVNTLPTIPIVGDVRQGVSYASGALTGTLVVPSPSNVRQGVPTDNTVGTADLTAQDFFTAIANSSDPIAVRLRNVATVQTTGDQIAAAL